MWVIPDKGLYGRQGPDREVPRIGWRRAIPGHMSDDTGTVIEPPGEHPHLRMTRTLEVDQVMTIEPGIYVIDMLIANLEGTAGYDLIDQQMLDWLRPYGGIRIEDNVRVLDDGCENLTRDAFAA